MKKLNFSYDESLDRITIEGVVFSGEFFRMFCKSLPINKPFKIVSRKNGVLEIVDTIES